jgi:anti-anti-sigma factor
VVDPGLRASDCCVVTPGLPPTSELSTEIVEEPDRVRLILRGELDMNGVLETERAVHEAAARAGHRLVIDLTDLSFMDLFGARALLRVASEETTPGREVVIANPHRHVRRLFELITDLARGRGLVIEMIQGG